MLEDQVTGPAEKYTEETRTAGTSQAGAMNGSLPARPRDGSMNGFRSPRSVALPPPNPVEAWYYEGMAAYQHRRWDEALDCFTRLKELQPDRPGLDALLDEVRWFQQLEAAAPAFAAHETRVPSRAETLRIWRRRLASLGLALLVVFALLGVASLVFVALEGRLPWQNGASQQEIETLLSQAEERRAAGDFDGAERLFEKVLLISPDSAEAREGIEGVQRESELAEQYAAVTAAIADEDWERAASGLSAILAVDPGYKDASSLADFVAQRQTLVRLYEEGNRLLEENKWEEALAQFEKMREVDASYLDETVADRLSACYILAGQDLIATRGTNMGAVERAASYFSRALDLDPEHPVAGQAGQLSTLYLAAMRASAGGEVERARSQLSLLLTLDPSYAGGEAMRLLYKLSVSQGEKALSGGNIQAALEIFEQAQGLPVSDTSAARNGYEIARVAVATPTATPAPSATVIPSPTPAPTSAPIAIAATPRPPAPVRATPTNTPVLVTCIRGRVVDAAGAAPLRQWAITLVDAAGARRVAVSGDSGRYGFDNLAPGVYKVWIGLPPGWRAVSPQPATINLAPAAQCQAVDFWSVREQVDRAIVPTPPR